MAFPTEMLIEATKAARTPEQLMLILNIFEVRLNLSLMLIDLDGHPEMRARVCAIIADYDDVFSHIEDMTVEHLQKALADIKRKLLMMSHELSISNTGTVH